MSETITRNDLSAVIKGLRLHEYATETASYSNTSIKGGTFDVWKIGRTVYFIANGNFSSLAAGTSSGWIEYITLDSQFCPINDVYVDVTGRSNGVITFKIASSGAVTIYNYGSAITSAQNGMVSGSWVTTTSTNYISNLNNGELLATPHPYDGRGQEGTAGLVVGTLNASTGTLPITQIHISNNITDTDTFYHVRRTDTNKELSFGIGAGGQNRGIYLNDLDRWLLYADEDGIMHLNSSPIQVDTNGSIKKVGGNVIYVKGRDSALAKIDQIGGYSTIISQKTPAGSWDVGNYATSTDSTVKEALQFNYCADTDYNSSTNNNKTALMLLNNGMIKINGSNLGDFVIEKGTSGIWTYQKWYSGIAECWGKADITTSASGWSAWGNGYQGAAGYWNYPSGLFTATPSCVMQVSNSGYTAWSLEIHSGATAARTATVYPMRPNNPGAAVTTTVSIIAKGTWK